MTDHEARSVFRNGGDMGELMASVAREAGPLGAVAAWPQNLRSILSVVLTSAQPIFVWWAPDLIQFYNDAYRPSFHAVFNDGAVELRVQSPAMPRTTDVDPDLWETIVLNLVSNAYKYTLKGSVTVSTALLDDHVELCVRDTGEGISDTDVDRGFDRFHRVPGVRSRSHEGTGIGLSWCGNLLPFSVERSGSNRSSVSVRRSR